MSEIKGLASKEAHKYSYKYTASYLELNCQWVFEISKIVLATTIIITLCFSKIGSLRPKEYSDDIFRATFYYEIVICCVVLLMAICIPLFYFTKADVFLGTGTWQTVLLVYNATILVFCIPILIMNIIILTRLFQPESRVLTAGNTRVHLSRYSYGNIPKVTSGRSNSNLDQDLYKNDAFLANSLITKVVALILLMLTLLGHLLVIPFKKNRKGVYSCSKSYMDSINKFRETDQNASRFSELGTLTNSRVDIERKYSLRRSFNNRQNSKSGPRSYYSATSEVGPLNDNAKNRLLKVPKKHQKNSSHQSFGSKIRQKAAENSIKSSRDHFSDSSRYDSQKDKFRKNGKGKYYISADPIINNIDSHWLGSSVGNRNNSNRSSNKQRGVYHKESPTRSRLTTLPPSYSNIAIPGIIASSSTGNSSKNEIIINIRPKPILPKTNIGQGNYSSDSRTCSLDNFSLPYSIDTVEADNEAYETKQRFMVFK